MTEKLVKVSRGEKKGEKKKKKKRENQIHSLTTCYSLPSQWYNDKLTELAPLHNVYLSPTPANTEAFIALSRQNWSNLIDVLFAVEKQITGPYALGDQVSLADVHLTAWLARLMVVACQVEKEKDEILALEKALTHECLLDNSFAKRGLGVKVCENSLENSGIKSILILVPPLDLLAAQSILVKRKGSTFF